VETIVFVEIAVRHVVQTIHSEMSTTVV